MTTAITYPNGTQFTTTALTVDQINTLLQSITCGMIGIDPPDLSAVRVDWPTEGQPFVDAPETDVCYLRCVLENDDYDKLRDLARTNAEPSPTPVMYTWTYTRVWTVHWIFYGPGSLNHASAVRSALFQEYFTDQLGLSQLFPNPDNAAPQRVPEQFNAQWWERVDFSTCMNEFVTETTTVPAVVSVPVTVESEDLTVSTIVS